MLSSRVKRNNINSSSTHPAYSHPASQTTAAQHILYSVCCHPALHTSSSTAAQHILYVVILHHMQHQQQLNTSCMLLSCIKYIMSSSSQPPACCNPASYVNQHQQQIDTSCTLSSCMTHIINNNLYAVIMHNTQHYEPQQSLKSSSQLHPCIPSIDENHTKKQFSFSAFFNSALDSRMPSLRH